MITEAMVDLNGMIASNDQRGPKGFEFIKPGVIDLFHFERDRFRDGVKESQILSELMSRRKQSVLRQVRRKSSGLKRERRVRIGHRITSLRVELNLLRRNSLPQG